MKILSLIISILLIGNCFNNKKEKLNIKTTKYQVIVKEGIIRKEPSIKSAVLGKVVENEIVEVVEFLPKEETLTIQQSFRDKWAKVLYNNSEIGYIFGALIQSTSLNDYECPKPINPIHIKVKAENSYIEFCSNGSYLLSEYYNCDGYNCSEHGCWTALKKTAILNPKKSFYYSGVGNPESCTHACTYKVYKAISKPADGRAYGLDKTSEFKEFSLDIIESLNDFQFEISKLPKDYNCKHNQLL